MKVNLDGKTVDVLDIRNSETIEKKDIMDYIRMFSFELKSLIN